MSDVKLNPTAKFAVLDHKSFKGDHKKVVSDAEHKRAELQRGTKEVGDRMASTGLIGGEFAPSKDPSRFSTRTDLFQKWYAAKAEADSQLPQTEISITLPNGDVKIGKSFKTTPMDIATEISKGLADSAIIAKVEYTSYAAGAEEKIVACDDDEEDEDEDEQGLSGAILWDMNRPLIGNCKLALLKFDDPEGKNVSIRK